MIFFQGSQNINFERKKKLLVLVIATLTNISISFDAKSIVYANSLLAYEVNDNNSNEK